MVKTRRSEMVRVVRLRFLSMDSRVGWLVCVRRLLPLIPPPQGWCWEWLDCLVGCYWLVTGCSFYDTSWLLWLLYNSIVTLTLPNLTLRVNAPCFTTVICYDNPI